VASRQRRVVWSRGAHRELEAAISHIAEEAPNAARALLEQLLATAASLETMSGRGRMVPERGSDYPRTTGGAVPPRVLRRHSRRGGARADSSAAGL
jgi:plasmid stabilization system protein ParE